MMSPVRTVRGAHPAQEGRAAARQRWKSDVLAEQLGRQWRAHGSSSSTISRGRRLYWTGARAPSGGRYARGRGGPAVPGRRSGALSDFTQVARLGRLFGALAPGLDIKTLLAELKERVAEELDYRLEAESQRAFASAFDGDPDILVPKVIAGADRVLVTEWIDGTPTVAGHRQRGDRGTQSCRLAARPFLFSGPERAGLLHADPHPGNWRLMPDGRLGVLDFGAVARLPDGLPDSIGVLLRIALDGDAAEVLDGLRARASSETR